MDVSQTTNAIARAGLGPTASDTKTIGTRGADVFVHAPGGTGAPAAARHFFNGSTGPDTLVLDLTGAEWMALAPSLRPEITAFLAHVEANTSRHGEMVGAPFEFASIGVVVERIGALKLRVDGIEISAEDAPVVAEDDAFVTNEHDGLAGNVLDNDQIEDLAREVRLVGPGPAQGDFSLNADGSFSFDPGAAFAGFGAGDSATVSFDYEAVDADLDSDTATVVIDIEGQNDAPVLVEETTMGIEDQPVLLYPLANDSDPDTGDALRIVALRGMSHGQAEIQQGGQAILFTPEADFDDGITFEYQVADSHGATSWGTLAVGFEGRNDAPIALDETASTTAGQSVSLAIEVSDPDTYDSHVLTVDASGLSGQVSLDPLLFGAITYDSGSAFLALGAGESTTESFSYTVRDLAGETDSAAVTITILGENDAPIAVDDVASTFEDTSVVLTPLSNDSDPDTGDRLSIVDLRQVRDGTATIAADGLSILFEPDANFHGSTHVDYQVADSGGRRDWGRVAVEVTPVNDAPVAEALAAATVEGEAVLLTPFFSDVDGGDSHSLGLDTSGTRGQVHLTPHGGLRYDPGVAFGDFVEGQVGTDTFVYTVTDAAGAEARATATVTVNGTNLVPKAADDRVTTDEDMALVVSVLGNDNDADSDPLQVTTIGGAYNGSAAIAGDGQTVTFTPDKNFNGEAGFTYTIADTSGATSSAEVIVDVSPINDAPVAVGYEFWVPEANAMMTRQLPLGFTDPDIGDSHTITAEFDFARSTGSSELWVDRATNSINYSANGFVGASFGELRVDTILATVTDAGGLQSTVTITASTLGENDPPTDFFTVGRGREDAGAFTIALSSVVDPDGLDTHEITGIANAVNGHAEIAPDGTINFTPDLDFNGEVSLDVTIADPQGASITKTVTHTVAPTADPIEVVMSAVDGPEVNQFYLDIAALRLNPASDENLLSVSLEAVDANGVLLVDQSAYFDQSILFTPNRSQNMPVRALVTIADSAPAAFSIRATVTALDGSYAYVLDPLSATSAVGSFDVDWSKSTQAIDETIPFDNRSIWADADNERFGQSFVTTGTFNASQDLVKTLIYLNATAFGVGAKSHISGAVGANVFGTIGVQNEVWVEGGKVSGGVSYDGSVEVVRNGVTDQVVFHTQSAADVDQSYFAAGSPNFGFSTSLYDFYLAANAYAKLWGYMHLKTGVSTHGPELNFAAYGGLAFDLRKLVGNDGFEMLSYDGAKLSFLEGAWETEATSVNNTWDSGEPYENEIATVTISNPTLASRSTGFDAISVFGGDRHELANFSLDLDGIAATIAGQKNPLSYSKSFGDFYGIKGPFGFSFSVDALDFDLVNRLSYQQNHVLTPGALNATLVLEDGDEFVFTFGESVRVGTLAEHDVNGDGHLAYSFRLDPDAEFRTQAQLVYEQFDQLDILKAGLEGWINLGPLQESVKTTIGPWKSTNSNVIDREAYIPITTQEFSLDIDALQTGVYYA